MLTCAPDRSRRSLATVAGVGAAAIALVIAAGPTGCELAQAFQAFGTAVTLLEADSRVLPRDDADAAAILERRLRAEGVQLLLGVTVSRAARYHGIRSRPVMTALAEFDSLLSCHGIGPLIR